MNSCPNCGARNQRGSSLCRVCSSHLNKAMPPVATPEADVVLCGSCGAKKRQGDAFCSKCGISNIKADLPTRSGPGIPLVDQKRLVRSNCWCVRGNYIYNMERVDLFLDGTVLNIVTSGTSNIIESIELRKALTSCAYEGTIRFTYKDNQKMGLFNNDNTFLYTSMPGPSFLSLIIRWFSSKEAKEISVSLNRYSDLSNE